ncbi:hypothetical protein DF118_34615 [Burkholderia stagnalis]|nr:hypothetical protein DF163_34735 [Burkholderia stagnalis]RQQ40149.1 hypothetical protein DF162_34375 [Burkholderia stagnalis]RQX85537.1 hypothetical protein DF119_35310 [Burkholderia stagnalis]RQY00799.1 hypothetical protein DF118_34615 [Burkholderia stagnalis]RQY27969.1 hypothetical protein DF116_35210 [Burkholderia stagnalis]
MPFSCLTERHYSLAASLCLTHKRSDRLTSTARTARFGPACRVVWEGLGQISDRPYPDFLAASSTSHRSRQSKRHGRPPSRHRRGEAMSDSRLPVRGQAAQRIG